MAGHNAPLVKELHTTLRSVVTGIRIDHSHRLIIEGVDAQEVDDPKAVEGGEPMLQTIKTHVGNLAYDELPPEVAGACQLIEKFAAAWLYKQ